MSSIIQAIALFYENHIKPHFFPQKDENPDGYQDLLHKKIHRASIDIRNCALPLDVRVEAIGRIGLMAYTGGHRCGRQAVNYMPAIIDFLKSPELSNNQKIVVVEGLVGICYIHLSNQLQARKYGLYPILQDLIAPTNQASALVKMWTCHLLSVLCCNNIPIIRTLTDSDSMRWSLETLASEDWFGWPKNYAHELLCILGYWPTDQN